MKQPYLLIDPTTIEQNFLHSRNVISQLLDLYLTQIPADLKALKDAILASDHTAIANKAHHIKPTMEYVGATTLRRKLQELETAGKNRKDMAIIQTLSAAIEQEIASLLQEIANYRREL